MRCYLIERTIGLVIAASAQAVYWSWRLGTGDAGHEPGAANKLSPADIVVALAALGDSLSATEEALPGPVPVRLRFLFVTHTGE